MEGVAYLTPSIEYAVIYALGGVHAGNTIPEKFFGREEYGYVFVVPSRELKDISPDEDSVGEMIYKRKPRWLHSLAEDVLIGRHTEWPEEPDEDDDEPFHEDWRDLYQQVMDGEYVAWAEAGKILLEEDYLTDEQELELISLGAHVAHYGALTPSQAWRISKRDSHLLRRDGSNFFKVATRIR